MRCAIPDFLAVSTVMMVTCAPVSKKVLMGVLLLLLFCDNEDVDFCCCWRVSERGTWSNEVEVDVDVDGVFDCVEVIPWNALL